MANTSENADEADRLGVEEEGVESSQIFVLGLTVLLSVLSAGLFVYFLFYLPAREHSRDSAEAVPGDRYVELRETRAEGRERIRDYATNEDSTFRIPIGVAMERVAEDYAGRQDSQTALALPATPNIAWVILQAPPAVRRAASASPAQSDSAGPVGQGAAPPMTGSTNAEDLSGAASGAPPLETGRTEQEGGNQPSLPAQRGTRSETQSVLDARNP